MNKLTHSNCLDQQLQAVYLAGVLDEKTEAALEDHIAGCEACAESIGHMFADEQEAAVWTAAVHGEAWRQETLTAKLVNAAAKATGALKKALERWIALGVATAAGTLSGQRRADSLILALEGAGSVGFRTRGTIQSPIPETIEVPWSEGLSAEVSVENGIIFVRFPQLPADAPAPVVLIEREESPNAAIAVLAEMSDEGNYLVQTPLPPGHFKLEIGPR